MYLPKREGAQATSALQGPSKARPKAELQRSHVHVLFIKHHQSSSSNLLPSPLNMPATPAHGENRSLIHPAAPLWVISYFILSCMGDQTQEAHPTWGPTNALQASSPTFSLLAPTFRSAKPCAWPALAAIEQMRDT